MVPQQIREIGFIGLSFRDDFSCFRGFIYMTNILTGFKRNGDSISWCRFTTRLIAVAFFTIFGVSRASWNLLRNPSFEAVTGVSTDQGYLPTDWIQFGLTFQGADTLSSDDSWGPKRADYGNFSNAKAFDGIRWVAGASTSPISTIPERFGQKLTQPLAPGFEYEISAELLSAQRHGYPGLPDLDSPGTYRVYLCADTAFSNTVLLGQFSPSITNQINWESRSFHFLAPTNTAGLPYMVFEPIATAGGTAYPGIDSVSLLPACISPPEGLIGCWTADGYVDGGGSLENGTVFTPGKAGQAWSFDGVDDVVSSATPALGLMDTFTIEFWVLPEAGRASTPETTVGISGTSGQRYAIAPEHGGSDGPAGVGVSVGTNGISIFEHADAYLPSLLVYDVSITNWTHIAVVYNNKQPTLYLNGNRVRTGLKSLRTSIFPSKTFGDFAGYGPFKGLLDEVSIYNRSLNANEIASIFIADSAGKCKPRPGKCIQNGNFESGDLASWTSSGIQGGFAEIVQEGTCFSANNTSGISINGSFAANVRSEGPATTNSIGILTSAPFVAGEAIQFRALSENSDIFPAVPPVLMEVRLIDNIGNVLIKQPVTSSVVTLSPANCDPLTKRNGTFSTHRIETATISGQVVQLEFRQHTTVDTQGHFTLIDDVESIPTSPLAILTAPTNQSVRAGGTVSFMVAPTTSDSVTYQWLFNGTVLVGAATSSLTLTNVQSTGAGRYSVVISDCSGAITSQDAIVTIITNLPPTVSVTSPLDATVSAVGKNIIVSGSASDKDGIVTKVEFYEDTTRLGTLTNAPYTMVWSNALAGNYMLTARAFDNDGLSSTSAPVNIIVGTPPNILPTVVIKSPANNAAFVAGSNITIIADANDSDGFVTRVVFYESTNRIGVVTNAPFSMIWSNVPMGDYLLTARAIDDSDFISTSLPVHIIASCPYQYHSEILVPYLASDYRYKIVPHQAETGFEKIGINENSYSMGEAGFGSAEGGCPLANSNDVRTVWPSDTDLLVRKTIQIPPNSRNLIIGVAIDNDVQVFLNGVDISGGLLSHEDCAVHDSIVINVPNDSLIAGQNLLAVRAQDRGLLSYFDLQVSLEVLDQPSLSVSDVTVIEGTSSGTEAGFLVNLSAPSCLPITCDYRTMDGTAISGNDYEASVGRLIFNSGETSKTITVAVLGDHLVEDNETFFLLLENPTNATISRVRGQGTILNDDTNLPPMVFVKNPKSGVLFSSEADIQITAEAIDVDGTIAKVEFFQGSLKLGEKTAAPYEFNWISVPAGSYVLTARAFDNDGLSSTSPPVQIKVVPLPSISVNDLSIREGDTGQTNVLVLVSLSSSSPNTVTVGYQTVDGSALAGQDYQAVSGTLVFAPGETNKSISVFIVGDLVYEPDESFAIILSGVSGGVIGKDRATITILNDDALPKLSINNVSVIEGNSGTTDAVFEVSLAGQSSLPVTVDYATRDGTAVTGSDYLSRSGSLTFAPNNAGSGAGSPLADLESPILRASASGHAIVIEWSSSGTSFDLQESDSIAISNGFWRKASAQVQFDGIRYSVSVVAADSSKFYRLASSAGPIVQEVRVPIVGDIVAEGTENFFVNLTNPNGATILSGEGEATIIDNDSPASPPGVSLASPENGDVFPVGSAIVVAANVTSGTSPVARVDFFANDIKVGSTSTAPYTISWSDAALGSYALKAVVFDHASGSGESTLVNIDVVPNDGQKRVAIVQNFADAEISRLQAWLTDLDLSSKVFNQEGSTFDLLKSFDLVIWDDLGTVAGGLSANDVNLFESLYEANIPLYFIGTKLVGSESNLPANVQLVWNHLIRLNPSGDPTGGTQVTVNDDRHPVNNGPFGLVGSFKLQNDIEPDVARGAGEQVVAGTDHADAVLAEEDSEEKTVTQNLLALEGGGVNATVQREKLFKNAVWWLLKLPPPPPFLNLSVDVISETDTPKIGSELTLTATVQHSGESEATGITMTMVLPSNLAFVSATSEAGTCVFEDGVVICSLGSLTHTDTATVVIVTKPNALGSADVITSVSPNQPEAVTTDNSITTTVEVIK
jgi:uncharacterized repeat protein (TIGR01451 family)